MRTCGFEATRVMLEHQERCQDCKTAKSPNVVVPTLHQSKLSRSSWLGKVLSTASFLFRQLANHPFTLIFQPVSNASDVK
jgi:hypothetical protein